MRQPEAGNARSRRSLQNIRLAFEDMVRQSDLNEITVSGICRRAGIGRKTFYVYYSSLDALARHMVREITGEFSRRLARLADKNEFGAIAREFLELACEKDGYYEKLFCRASYSGYGNKILDAFVRAGVQDEAWFNALPPATREMAICFIFNAGVGLYRQWVANGKQMSIDDLCACYGVFMANGLNGLCGPGAIMGRERTNPGL